MENKGLPYYLKLQIGFLWLLGMVLCGQLHAQEYFARNMLMLSNVNTDNGLSSARVYTIVEAEDGAMWISTKRGVDRYNGQQVKNYSLATELKYSDASGRTIQLTKDQHGQVYAYDNKGKIYIYNKVVDAFTLKWNLVKVLGGSVVLNQLTIDPQGNFWLALDKGAYMLSPNGTCKTLLKDRYCNHVQIIHKQLQPNQSRSHDILLIGASDGIFLYSPAYRQTKLLYPNISVLSSYHDAKLHQVWLGTFHQGVMVVDDRTWRECTSSMSTTIFPSKGASLSMIPNIPVRSILPYDNRMLLLGVDGAGVYAYDRLTRQTRLLLNTDGRLDNVLTGNGVYTLCRDRFGDLWIGSYSGGVDLAVPMEHSLEYVSHEYLSNQSLIDNSVNAILTSQGKIWYATDKGVSIFDEHTQQWHHGLYNKVVLTICKTQDGRVLAGTYGDGVFQINADGSSSQVYSTGHGNLKTDYVYSLFNDSDGSLWIGCLDQDMVCISKNGISYVPIDQVQCIVESPDKKSIAVGTSHGAYLVDKRTHRINQFYDPANYTHGDQNCYVNAMDFQDKGHVWLATDGGGVLYFDLKTHAIQTITTDDGLPSNTIYTLVKRASGRIWVSTDKGLAFIEKNKVVNLNFFKGLECEYKRMAVAQLPDGRIIYGSSNGAVILAPKFARGLNYSAPLHITGVDVEGLKWNDASDAESWSKRIYQMLQDGKLCLGHSDNTLSVNFESINYQYQHDIQYQYYLEGFDHQWSQPSASQSARFVNLPPGNYTLHVKAIGRSNQRVLDEKTLEIHIAQPWWNSWWAWIVYLCILGAIAYFGWDYYLERLHRKYYDEKINFFVNTAHNIRTPLSLVLAPLADLAKDTSLGDKSRKFLEMAQRNGDKLLRMVTELLDFQKIDQAKAQVHLQPVELSILLHQQVDKFQMSAGEKHILIRMAECPQHTFSTDLSMMDLIFENLLSNAVKYTEEGGCITVSAGVDEADKQINIRVSDTGIGIPRSEAKYIFQSFFRASNAVNSQEMGSGLGLMLTRQLVQKLGGKLSFESEEGKGTTFIVTLPIAEKAEGSSTSVETPSDVSVSFRASTDASTSSEHLNQQEASEQSVSSDEKIKSNEELKSEEKIKSDEESLKDTLLFVDDNEDLRQYICMAFSEKYHVVDVESGEAALRYLEENGECDIVVSDVMMPGMQGDELCRRIKESKETSWLPVILLTAKAGRDFMIEGLGLGADDYIAKPFDSAILASKIDSMLRNRRRMSQYYMERSLAIVRGEASVSFCTPTGVSESSEPSSSNELSDSSVSSDENKKISDEEPVESSVELNPQDQTFVDKATRLVLDNLSDTDFNIDRLCREMAMSRTLFYGRLKTLTGQAPQDFMRMIRLEQAAQFLKQGESVLDVSVKAGFVNVKYFSTVFKKYFGVSPSKYK